METVADIAAAHRSGAAKPEETVARSYARIRAHADDAIFITLRDEATAVAEARDLDANAGKHLPLLGVPVAIKDNIDVGGLPTTAACPAFAYQPDRDAVAVANLRHAGAVVIGKTNLDQFATGLVGVRSPYGVPRNPFDAAVIPGGSSSGSAVAVAAGLVPLALGTDTAGSGRVPAGLNNIVGLKPSLGLVSTSGIVPACRSLDCVSIFALTVDDAYAALAAIAEYDESDAYSRPIPLAPVGPLVPNVRVAVPRSTDRKFFGDTASQSSFEAAIDLLNAHGMAPIEIDLSRFLDTARLLYEGPWVAERWAAVGDFVASHPDDVHPVTRQIIAAGEKPSAADAFRAFYRLAALRTKAHAAMASFDVLMVPTAPAAYRVSDVLADPVTLNSNLGTYTNFVNLLDLAGLAVPISLPPAGMPYGVTLLARSGADGFLASLGRALHAWTGLPLGALRKPAPPLPALAAKLAQNELGIAVVGAHLSGMPLNPELRALGARFIETTRTARDYHLYALAGTQPPKPGMLRVAKGTGAAIELEIWALSAEAFGRFVAAIPSPLSIGTVALADGRNMQGFLVEAEAVNGARDISDFGGWRAFMAHAAVPA